ncbi:hypothetical protein B0W81_02370 [Prochlorococcus sp. HOT_208_60]|nr:hypothetical protein B0W81_02370 [Prochlorococcus sp. HOT_208_60]
MKIKKVLIISFGSIGRRHFKVIKKLRPEIEINLLRRKISHNKSKEEVLANKIFTNIKDAIKYGADAAIVASPAKFHIEHSIEILNANIPLFIEKPISDSLKNSLEFKKLAKKKNNLVLVGYVLRHSKIINEFKRLINENHIGEKLYAELKCGSYLPNWRKNIDYRESVSSQSSLGGGVLLELSHEIDYANWLFGPFHKVKSIYTNTQQLRIDVEDIAKIIAINNQNFLLQIHLDFCSNSKERFCKLFGTLGFINLDFMKKSIIIKKNNCEKSTKIKVEENYDDMYMNQMRHFFSCIENNVKPFVTIDDAIETLSLISLCNGSKL